MKSQIAYIQKNHSIISFFLSVLASIGLSFYYNFGFSNKFFLFFIVCFSLYHLSNRLLTSFEKRRFIFSLLFAIPLTISFAIGDKITYSTTAFSGYSFLDIPQYLSLLFFILLMTNFLLSLRFTQKPLRKISLTRIKHPKLVAFVIILLCWLPYWIAFMPGIISVDTIVQFKQAVDPSQLSNWHPILHTILLGIPVKIGYILNNITAGIVFAVLLQEITTAAILANVTAIFARVQKKTLSYIILTAFFALCPVVALYAVTPWKDIIFSSLFLLLLVLLFELLKSGRRTPLTLKTTWKIAILVLLVPFFRNGGILISLSIITLLAFYYKKQLAKVLVSGAIIIASILIIQGPGYKLLKIQSSPFMESMSIPAQQIAYVAANNKLYPEDLEELDHFADIDLLVGSYTPMHADAAKNSFDYEVVEQEKGRFIKLWVKLLSYNPGSFVKAYVYHTYSYWYIGEPTWIDDYTNVHKGEWLSDWDYSDINIFGEQYRIFVAQVFRALPRTSWFGFFTNVGALVWCYIFMFISALYRKRKTVALLFIPIFVYIASLLIASPVSWIFRYIYILLLALPVFFCLTFFHSKKKLSS